MERRDVPPFSLPDWSRRTAAVPSADHADAAAKRQANLTKPIGALGRLESLAVTMAGLQATDRPRADVADILLFAGDHGVTAQGVSAYPSAVTVQMLVNFARGGAAIAVLARELGANLTVVDVGSVSERPVPGVVTRKVRAGTRDFSIGHALTPDEVAAALDIGAEMVRDLARRPDVLILGEMGIGNTTAAAALAAALLALPASRVAGLGTGIGAERLAAKVALIDAALARHGLARKPADAAAALAAVGGLEIAALTGAMIAAAQNGIPVLVDGFIVAVAALLAVRHNPSVRPWLIFSHASAEQGHRVVLDALAAEPLVDFGLRLGEASGAAVVLPIVRAALALHNGMATFAEAGVAGRSPP